MQTKVHWFSLGVGILLVVASLFMFIFPVAQLTALGLFFSIVVLIGGVIELVRYISAPRSTRSIWSLVNAVVTVLVGVFLMTASASTQAALIPVIVGCWAIILGICRILVGLRARYLSSAASKHMVFSGAFSLILGILVCLFPLLFGSLVVWLVALAILLVGVALIGDFFVSRKGRNRHTGSPDGVIDVEAR